MAKTLKIKSPSLYNHISNLEDLKNKISLYGWKQLEEKMLLSIVGESGYEAIKCMAYAFYDYTTENKLDEINTEYNNKYELVLPEPNNKNGEFKREEQTITYYYQKKNANVKVLHVLEGTDVSDPENVTDTLYDTENIHMV